MSIDIDTEDILSKKPKIQELFMKVKNQIKKGDKEQRYCRKKTQVEIKSLIYDIFIGCLHHERDQNRSISNKQFAEQLSLSHPHCIRTIERYISQCRSYIKQNIINFSSINTSECIQREVNIYIDQKQTRNCILSKDQITKVKQYLWQQQQQHKLLTNMKVKAYICEEFPCLNPSAITQKYIRKHFYNLYHMKTKIISLQQQQQIKKNSLDDNQNSDLFKMSSSKNDSQQLSDDDQIEIFFDF